MARMQPDFEWHVNEDTYLHTIQSVGTVQATPPKQLPGWWLGARTIRALLYMVGSLGLSAFLVASTSPTVSQRAHMQAYNGIYRAIVLESQAQVNHDIELFHRLIDQDVSHRTYNHWHTVWNRTQKPSDTTLLTVNIVDNKEAALTAATLHVARPQNEWWDSGPYIEKRFYRKMPKGWVRTMPQAAFWEAARSLETPHLRFEYAEQDAEAIAAVAYSVDAFYQELYAALRVDPRTSNVRPTFVVLPDFATNWTGRRARYEVTSPTLAKIPVDVAETAFLTKLFTTRLAYRAINRTLHQSEKPYLPQWETMLWGLIGKLYTELQGARSPWHYEARAAFGEVIATPLVLEQEAGGHTQDGYPSWTQRDLMREYMVAESLWGYIETEYGHPYLPVLLRGFSAYGSWAELVQPVFGVSVDEFQAGWNQYILGTYSIAPGEF